MEFLTKDFLKKIANNNEGRHWSTWEKRWRYFGKTVELVKTLGIDDPSKVLEMGTMGATIVLECDTIDYTKKWNFKGKNPTYIHDARKTPWPVEDKKYELFIALRVFQHLSPVQKECFLEAKRISKSVLIVVPESYRKDTGIPVSRFIEWNNGKKPDICKKLYGSTHLLFWE